jgi:hypothetical protein
MEEEEDDLYGTSAPSGAYHGASGQATEANGNPTKGRDSDEDEDLEEGEEEESDSESVRFAPSPSFIGTILIRNPGHRDCHRARRLSRAHNVRITLFLLRIF